MTPLEKSELLTSIKSVIETGKPWKSKALHYPAEAIIKTVLAIRGMKKRNDGEDDGGNGEGFSMNGWQWDWWQNFTHSGKNYTLSGSGYYGGHSFNLSDE